MEFKILSILISGLLLFCNSIDLYEHEIYTPTTEESTEKKSSNNTEYDDFFGENEKDLIFTNGLLKKHSRSSNKINFNLPIAYYAFFLCRHLNQGPRPPPITS